MNYCSLFLYFCFLVGGAVGVTCLLVHPLSCPKGGGGIGKQTAETSRKRDGGRQRGSKETREAVRGDTYRSAPSLPLGFSTSYQEDGEFKRLAESL